MQRYFLSSNDYKNLKITNDDLFHIKKVMRNKVGDLIEVVYDGICSLGEITEITNDYVSFKIIKELGRKEANKNKLTLIQGMPKGDKTENILMHSTELGVNEIFLVEMVRSVVKIDLKKLPLKLNRYEKILKEASEQAHLLEIPLVSYYKGLKEINYANFDLKLLLDEEEAKKENGRLLKSLDLNQKNICFVIGPEGGIDNSEREYLLKEGFIPVSLGKNILRTETASLGFLAMLKYALM